MRSACRSANCIDEGAPAETPTTATRRTFKASIDERKKIEITGLLVESVDDDGPASRTVIQLDDVILSINGEKIASVEQLYSLVAKHSKHMAWLILRRDQKMFVPINLVSINKE